MGLMDKLWDEVFTGSQPSVPSTNPKPDLHISLPDSSLERSDSSPIPSPAAGGPGRRASESNSVRPSVSEKIHISSRRPTLDTAHSLPSGFSYLPSILSPGARSKDENVWRSVFHPGTPNRNMESLGASKFDKADGKGPSVYDWFYRAECRPKYR